MSRRFVLPAATLAALLLPSLAPAAPAPGLPTVSSGALPGPDALYGDAPRAPQLENRAPWKAEPILVSGAQAYRGGEWLYQDFLYDDHGAGGVKDPGDPHDVGSYLFSPTTGTLTYPTDPVFAYNAADLVELRIKPLADATAFRVTLNTLKDPERTAFTIALGASDAAQAWPHGAGVSSPAQKFVTVHGTTAELTDAATGAPQPGGATATVDLERRQVDVRVPHAAFDPGERKVRVSIGVGLWDKEAGSYLVPGAQASETQPGGAAPSRAALFNVGPRFDEPNPDVTQFGGGVTIGDAAAGAAVDGAWWRERKQADQLRLGDVTPFAAEVDFGKLARGTGDESGVPSKGPIDRILASRHVLGQGIDPSKVCFDIASSLDLGAKCEGRFVGQLQPYALYLPDKPKPAAGWGMTLLLHSLSANYNQYAASKNQSQLGERASGSLVATPAGRGPDGFYKGIAEADTFEVWADVARHYDLDPSWAAVSGYSMGGFGTYRLLARWPDLFGRGFSVVGIPGSVDDQLASLRNTPILAWNAAADELVRIDESEQAVADLTKAGVRFIEDLFPAADHLTIATNDEYGPGAEFLGDARADRNPPHVTYVVDPTEDNAAAQAIGDHAYWVSGLRVRDGAKGTGTIDARSEAFGTGDADVQPVASSDGTVDGGVRGPLPYHRREQAWGKEPATAKRDALVVKATNVASATVDAARAGLSCAPVVDLQSDGPLDLRIACSQPKKACARTVGVKLPRVRGRRIVEVRVVRGGKVVKRVRGRDLKSVKTTRAKRIRLVMKTSGKPARTVSVTRRFKAC